MRWMNRTMLLAALLTISAVSVMAQSQQCTEEFKTATYSKWYDNRVEHQDVAFQAAEEYLAVCADDPSPYTAAIKKFHAAYKELRDKSLVGKQFEEAFQKKNYAEQIRLGKQILAKDPDNPAVNIIMGVAGLGDANQLTESAPFAKKAIELIQTGKPISPYTSKDQALAHLNYVIAKATAKTSATDAIPYFVKAARFDSELKKNPLLYNELGGAYGEGPVAKLAEDYKKFIGQPESTESKLVLANLNQALDMQIDAFARAAALSSNPTEKKALMDVLTEIYKGRTKSDTAAGLNELVAGILNKPLPDMPPPITTLPAVTPTAAGTGSTGTGSAPTGSAASGAASNTRSIGTTNTSGSGTQTGTPSKPTASPTPKPKPRRTNHRGR